MMKKILDEFRNYFKDISKDLANISKEIKEIKKNNDKEHDLEFQFIREKLGSIDILTIDSVLDGLPEKNKNEVYVQSSLIFNSSIFIPILDRMIMEQLNFASRKAETWEESKFSRATINGIMLVKEQFEAFESEYRDMMTPKERIDSREIS